MLTKVIDIGFKSMRKVYHGWLLIVLIVVFCIKMPEGFCETVKQINTIESQYYCPNYVERCEDKYIWFKDFFRDVICDYSIYYGKENLPWAAGMLGAASLMANTKFDQSVHRSWQRNYRSRGTDTFFKIPHSMGAFSYFRVYIGSMVLGYWGKDEYLATHLLYHWGYRALRAMLILSPQEVFLSNQLGNGRPYLCESSKWRIFKHKIGKAGCSGHAFNGAVPFLTAAFMTEEPLLRYTLFALSTLPGLCRINDDRHFFSQVFIGWCLSFLATRVVDIADCERAKAKCEQCMWFQFVPMKKGAMLRGQFQF